MRIKLTLILDEGDVHPASLSLNGSAGIVLDSENCGHVEVSAAQVMVDSLTAVTDEQDEPQDY